MPAATQQWLHRSVYTAWNIVYLRDDVILVSVAKQGREIHRLKCTDLSPLLPLYPLFPPQPILFTPLIHFVKVLLGTVAEPPLC